MGWQDFKEGYLHFSRKDRIGLLCLLAVSLIIYLLPYLSSPAPAPFPLTADSAILTAVDSLQAREASAKQTEPSFTARHSDKRYSSDRNSFVKGVLFPFDPNTLPEEGWIKLGLNRKTSRTIINYRAKGGRFYKPEDIKKIWGMPEGFYQQVKDYINIPPALTDKPYSPSYPKSEKESRTIALLNINTADTASLIALPGIGSKLAARILNFRQKLGGFHSVEQLGETYGLPDSTFQKLRPYMKVREGEVRRININTAGKDELKGHPYIKWHLANAIVEYRSQHGPFASVEDLKKIVLVDEAVLEKIQPYLTVE